MGDDKKDKKKALHEIQETLMQLLREQRALRAEVSRLAARVGAAEGGEPSQEVLDFLDAYRALEAAGELGFSAWIAVCEDDRLRGGLRTIRMREGIHARLLEERIKLLGGSVGRDEPGEAQQEALDRLGSGDIDDAAKLHEFVSRFPDIDAALAPIEEMARRLGPDHETRALLEGICADERASLEFLHAECARLNPESARD